MSVQPLAPGTALGELIDGGPRYRVLDVMGRGGFGITYRCLDRKLDVEVVVKELAVDSLCLRDTGSGAVVPADNTRSNADRLERVTRRFVAEAQTLARISHQARTPHVVNVSDQWSERGTAYYAMSMVRARGTWPQREWASTLPPEEWERVASYGTQLLRALEIVHTHGVACHGDLKPANVLIDDSDRVVLIDFGTVRDQEELTRGARTVFHTPAWSAPELQARSSLGDAGAWSDLYGWGLMMWGAARRHPVTSWDHDLGAEVPTPVEAAPRSLGHDPYADPRPLLDVGVPAPWAHAIVRCLAIDPALRPRSAREVLDAIERNAAPALPPQPPQPPQPPLPPPPQRTDSRPQIDVRTRLDHEADRTPRVADTDRGLVNTTGSTPQARPSRAGVVVLSVLCAAVLGAALAWWLFPKDEPIPVPVPTPDAGPDVRLDSGPDTTPPPDTTPQEPRLAPVITREITENGNRWVYRVSRRGVGAARDEAAEQEYLIERTIDSVQTRGAGRFVTFMQGGGISQPSERELVFEDRCVASPLDGQRLCIPSSRQPERTFSIGGEQVLTFTGTLQLERADERVNVALAVSPTWGVVEERHRDISDGREREWTVTLVAASVGGRTLGDPSMPVPFCDWHDSSFRRSGIYNNEFRSNEHRAWDPVDLPPTAGIRRMNLRQAGATLNVDFDGRFARSWYNARFFAAKAWSDGIRTWIMLELDRPDSVEFVVFQVQRGTVSEVGQYSARLQPNDRYGIFILSDGEGCFFEFRRFVGSATHVERRRAAPGLALIGNDRLFR